MILDGFGGNPAKRYNGIAEAATPKLDEYFSKYSHTLIEASGRASGLPVGQMGNSEVGHITLGCGQIVRQDLVKIDDAIADGSFYRNQALCEAMQQAKDQGGSVHLIGLVSDGGVHSHINHLTALIKHAAQFDIKPILHMICDGRDTPPKTALNYLAMLQPALTNSQGIIATVSGRYYAMDRDNRWERTHKAWLAIAKGKGIYADTAVNAIKQAYAQRQTDEFIEPTVLTDHCPLRANDAIIFFNFRKDRPRQLIEAISEKHFTNFERGTDYQPLHPVCMTQYNPNYNLPYAFTQDKPDITLGKYLADLGIKQFRCAETEKFAHVTYFFNGGRTDAYPYEDRVIIPSPKVATYDLKPEMSAHEVANAVIKAIESKQYAFILVNFANGDMVGHTAIRDAIIKAVEALDKEVGRVLDTAVAYNYSVLLTADHGNCDEYIDSNTGNPHTQHTIYPVPCLIVDDKPWRMATGGALENIAPTVLHLMGLSRPASMTGESLLLLKSPAEN
ncbi:phosphoglyceromutase [Achromatium sp. WMS1]|nr:phosphoglyceromutase [Achromatium sp. WMS1]